MQDTNLLHYINGLYSYAMALTRNQAEAEHLVQETYVRIGRCDSMVRSTRGLESLNRLGQAIFQLESSGVSLRSTYESNIDETAGGKLAANIFGSFNQFWSDAHSEKQRDRKRLAVAGAAYLGELQSAISTSAPRMDQTSEQRERVQNLLFESGLEYSPESGFLNRSESSLFNALETADFQKVSLVDLIGIEPITSSMP